MPENKITADTKIVSRMKSHFYDAINIHRFSMQALVGPLALAVNMSTSVLENNCKILACGNGGSASDAQHFVAELVGRLECNRSPLPGIALSSDSCTVTAISNDYGFNKVFERQIKAIGKPGDLLLAISTSGNSGNVLQAIRAAQELKMYVVALTGRGGGAIGQLMIPNNIHLCVPHNRTMRIQEIHTLLLHALCDGIDSLLSEKSY